jgi:dihydroflavonol-4-reductase
MDLVTGATGLTGSHLLLALCRGGREVRALKRRGSDLGVVRRVFAGEAPLLERVTWVEGDVLDITSLADAVAGVADVYHCAGYVSFVPSEAGRMLEVNVGGTANLVNACLPAGIRRFLHVSSVAAINRIDENRVIDENVPWAASKEHSRYAVSKYGAEREVWRGMAEGLPAVVINPSIIIGPGDWKRSSDALFARVDAGMRYYSDGVTGFVDVDDVVRCLTGLAATGITGQRYIVSAENVPYRSVLDWIADGLGRPRPSVQAGPARRALAWRLERVRSALLQTRPLVTRETARAAGKRVRFSNDKIRKALGIDFVPVREAVARTCRVFLEEHPRR